MRRLEQSGRRYVQKFQLFYIDVTVNLHSNNFVWCEVIKLYMGFSALWEELKIKAGKDKQHNLEIDLIAQVNWTAFPYILCWWTYLLRLVMKHCLWNFINNLIGSRWISGFTCAHNLCEYSWFVGVAGLSWHWGERESTLGIPNRGLSLTCMTSIMWFFTYHVWTYL